MQRASVEEAALHAVFPQLVEAVRATDIIDQLYQRNLLEKHEYEGIVDALPKDDSNYKSLDQACPDGGKSSSLRLRPCLGGGLEGKVQIFSCCAGEG